MMEYEEILPSPNLRKYVKTFWVLKQSVNSIESATETILPDGSLEIVFNLGDEFRRIYAEGKHEKQPRSILVGQMRSSVQIQPSGGINLFGIRFQPLGAYHFFKFPLNELTDKIQSLDLVLSNNDKFLEIQINEASTTAERIAISENFLRQKLSGKSVTDNFLEGVVENILLNRGMVSVGVIAKEFGIEQRRLERHFQQKIGISPKFFCRIIRIQNVICNLQNLDKKDLNPIALSFNYYDQSHFNHEFQEFSGKSPSAFFSESNQINEFFTS
ncbi:MAG TPA: helix-turn-helix domain-containing protein [Pyrinomonadaceae bacterium]|nr:helix-turn-helix domain-containing protein [Pyrinomonadaceae bacterium]